ncbi:vWA domain-containing protein [Ferrimonas marina]|uniref:Ca-activated chloride channel family protein n=1 Tax=Ferrimonas marina TaxID=299255 RepID=A0A1M5YA22_9GAMM|nr:VWA domain-containing protein [Ferrimonas marina]SHI08930.1 Ca-activated chloride channel family protein [Ferrimonas marina]
MLSLAWPWLLLLLPLPWLLPRRRPAQAAALRLPGALAKQLPLAAGPKPKALWQTLAALAWLLLVVASTRPLWLGEPVALTREGRDLMVAVDLSGSMQIEDMELNGRVVDRYTVVQSVLGEFIQRREGDRLGLILFADQAYLQAPLTFDRAAVRRYLTEAELGLVGTQTAIGDAIALAVKRFEQLEQSSRVLVLLTDGENNAGRFSPEQAVDLARRAGVTLYTIGVGSSEISQRRLFGTRTVNPSAELDRAEQTFAQHSESTGGAYFRARNTAELEAIYSKLDELEPIAQGGAQWRPQTELYHWPLGAATALLLLLLLRRRHG